MKASTLGTSTCSGISYCGCCRILIDPHSYICEIAPKTKRGTLVAVPQLLVTAGTCLGYFTCYGSVRIDSSISWRLPFLIQAIGGIILFVFCCIIPNSPRWMVLHNHREQAIHAVKRLDISTQEAEKDILGPAEQELRSQAPNSGFKGLLTVFERKHIWRTMLGLFILGMVQLCGIDGILYVSVARNDRPLVACEAYFGEFSLPIQSSNDRTSFLVCPHFVYTSWTFGHDGFLPGIGGLWTFHASHLNSRLHFCRPMGTQNFGDYRWYDLDRMHVYYRKSLCIRQCPCERRRRKMGRHTPPIRIRNDLCLYLGYCWKDLCD